MKPPLTGLLVLAMLAVESTAVRAAFPDLRLVPVSSGAMVAPVDIAHSGDGSGRIFIADQLGTIRILNTATGTLLATPFLDLSAKLVPITPNYDERGLLGLAFHPDYETNGKFYVYYSAPSPNVPGTTNDAVNHMSVVAEYTVSAGDANVADAGSERILFTLDQPQPNHNGGDLLFGPGGKLFISSGDGGNSNDDFAGHTGGSSARPVDALGNAQDKTNLLGKILRIDPQGNNGPGGQYGIPGDNPFVGQGGGIREEIYAYGLRNPWKMSYDAVTSRLYAADVGQGKVEEVNLIVSGGNYGWRNREGSFDFAPDAPGTGPFIDPIAQYAHPGVSLGSPALPQFGISVTGGEVYRGGRIPALVGKYVFADWSNHINVPGGTMLGLEEFSPEAFELSQLAIKGGNPISFFITALGSDEQGELYVAARRTLGPANDATNQPSGTIFRVAPEVAQVQLTLPANQDNSMYSELPAHSNGAGVNLFAGHILGRSNGPGQRRALVRFDLSTIPTGTAIQSASVILNVNRDVSGTASMQWHRVTSDWGEGASDALDPGGEGIPAAPGDVTWNHRFHDTQPWIAAGGDFAPTASATLPISGTGLKTWTSAGLAQDVTDWVNGTHSNFGWILRDPGIAVSAKRFDSREAVNPALRPKLVVSYGESPSVPVLLGLAPGSDTGASSTDRITGDNTPSIRGYAPLGATVQLLVDGTPNASQVVTTLPFTITTSVLPDGVRAITAIATENGTTGGVSSALMITINTSVSAGVPDLVAASDTGVYDYDNITSDNTPNLISAGGAGVTIEFSSDLAGVIGSGAAGSQVTSSALADGVHFIRATATDLAGNIGLASSALTVTIDTTAPDPPTGLDLAASSDTGGSDEDNKTFDRSLEVTGHATADARVNLASSLAGAVGIANAGTPWTITTARLETGVHRFTATATDQAGNISLPSAPLDVEITDARELKPIAVPPNPTGLPTLTAIAWTPSAAGVYDGLLRHSGDNATVIGAISKFTLTSAGAFSGVVQLGGRRVSVRNTLLPNGSIFFLQQVSGGGSVSVDFQLAQNASGRFFLQANQVAFNGTLGRGEMSRTRNPLPAPGPGPYTMLIPSESSWTPGDPSGDGWARINISATGGVTVAGKLGDGVSFSESAFVSEDSEINIFTDLYRSTPDGERGSIGGRMVLREVHPFSDLDGKLYWRKFADFREARYPAGFNLNPWAIGSKYTPPITGQRVLALDDQDYNAELSFIGPTAPATDEESLDRVLSWKATNTLVHYGPQSLAGTATAKNGGMAGSFFDPVSRERVTFSGVAFQKQNIAAGTFVSGTATGAVRIKPGNAFRYPGSESAGTLDRVQLPDSPAGPPVESVVPFETAAAGRFDGVLTNSHAITGAVENIALTSARSLSGTLWIQGTRYGFRAVMGSGGEAAFDIVRPSPLPPIAVDFDLTLITGSTDGFGFTGTVTIDGIPHTLDAQRRPAFTRAIPAPEAGLYTVAMRAPDVVDPALVPGGDGYGTMFVSDLGRCTGSITLADGTAVTLAGHVGRAYDDSGKPTSEWSFHRGLYGRTPKGYLAGKLTFRALANVSDVDGEWRWVKQAGALPVLAYPSIDVTRNVIGNRYVAPLAGVRAIDELDPGDFNVWLRFGGPNLGAQSTLDRAATWTAANRLRYIGPQRVSLSFNARNGLITGTYSDFLAGVNVRFGGVLLQAQDLVSGSYRTAATGLSGLFTVEPRQDP